MDQIIQESEKYSLTFYKPDHIVTLIWKKQPQSVEFREVYMNIIAFALKNKVFFFISDIRLEGPMTIQDLHWLKNDILPMVSQLELKKIAIISEDTIYSTTYAETIKKKFKVSQLPFEIFEDIETAKSWILKEH
jgi:hypothetical protein